MWRASPRAPFPRPTPAPSTAIRPARPTPRASPAAKRTQNLVFAVVLTPDVKTIDVDGVDRPLTSGMAATVELKTGSRRLIEYLFSPLVEVASRAMRKR